MEINIRKATREDIPTIAGFNAAMASETEGKKLPLSVTGPGVAALINEPSRGHYWLAESDGRIVGQLMITFEWSDWRNGNVWWIQSVYIPPEHRRQGIYSSLYAHVRDLAIEDPEVCGLRLYVEKDNHRAQATYVALGMTRDTYVVMEDMFNRPTKE